ncbi:MAG TPA: RNA polymerase sigma factor [Gammaproteobacteria bacterium]|nr:RNA polymerase sigma factor [Gammaproteobacteria bacterium]
MNEPLPIAPLADAPDAELARRVAAREPAAFEALMRRYNRRLFRTARAILRDDAEAEDALQEAYLQVYRAIGAFRGEAKLSTWLVRIVANEALMRMRKRTRRAEILPFQPGASDSEIHQIADTNMDDTPEVSAQRTEMRRLIEAQIDLLPDDFRAVFMLRSVEEMSVEETAEALGIPPATVRTRLFRARSLLREGLAAKIDLACEEAFSFAGERCDRIVARVLARIEGLERAE